MVTEPSRHCRRRSTDAYFIASVQDELALRDRVVRLACAVTLDCPVPPVHPAHRVQADREVSLVSKVPQVQQVLRAGSV